MSVSGTQKGRPTHTPYYELLLAAWLWCVRGRACAMVILSAVDDVDSQTAQ